jgi:SAM-dependent methyltransferase
MASTSCSFMPVAKIKSVFKAIMPAGIYTWLRDRKIQWTNWPPVGLVFFGSLRRVRPISRLFGLDRGIPIDRYYIEKFLHSHCEDIEGRVLEVGDSTYTRKFGGDKVSKSEVLHVTPGNPKATLVADLTSAEHILPDIFDCIILTQTLQFIYDTKAALGTVHRILKPGGVLLATMSGISQISRYDMERWGEYWRFTTRSARQLFEEVFDGPQVAVQVYGNVLAAISFLHGLSAQDLRQEELDYYDPDYEVLIAVKAIKS